MPLSATTSYRERWSKVRRHRGAGEGGKKQQQQQQQQQKSDGDADAAEEMGAVTKELEDLRIRLAREEQNAAMLEQQAQEASLANAQHAADKTALESKRAALEATVSELESENHKLKVLLQEAGAQQPAKSSEEDAQAATAEVGRLKEALKEAEAASAQQQAELTKRLKESEEEKKTLQRSADSKGEELLLPWLLWRPQVLR